MRSRVKFIITHLYMVLLILSVTGMTVAGAVLLPQSGEKYTQIQSLAGLAVHEIKKQFEDLDEDGMLELDDDSLMLPVKDSASGNAAVSDNFAVSRNEAVSGNETGDGKTVSENGTASENEVSKSGKDNEPTNPVDYSDESMPWLYPDWQLADKSYFYDALFIGDSRELGFGMFSKLDGITVYAKTGLQIYKVGSKAVVDAADGKITIAEALQRKYNHFKKVYIMFGMNEMGMGNSEKLDAYYYNLIDYVKQTQPEATIYLQGIIHVSQAKAASSPIFANYAIDARNERLREIAANEHIYFLDLNEVFTDENGALFPDAASDGIHLKGKYIMVWRDYIMAHAIIRKNADGTPMTPVVKDVPEGVGAYINVLTDENGQPPEAETEVPVSGNEAAASDGTITPETQGADGQAGQGGDAASNPPSANDENSQQNIVVNDPMDNPSGKKKAEQHSGVVTPELPSRPQPIIQLLPPDMTGQGTVLQ